MQADGGRGGAGESVLSGFLLPGLVVQLEQVGGGPGEEDVDGRRGQGGQGGTGLLSGMQEMGAADWPDGGRGLRREAAGGTGAPGGRVSAGRHSEGSGGVRRGGGSGALHSALLATLVAVPALGANKAVLYGFLVLGLAALLEQTRGGPGEEAVLLLMAKM